MRRFLLILFLAVLLMPSAPAQTTKTTAKPLSKTTTAAVQKPVLPGAYMLGEYLPLLKNKRVAVFANHTATIGNTHLVDTLRKLGITISKIFGPEHGFRGTANAGEIVSNTVDEQTGIPVISLYGKKRKPTADDLSDVDVLLFDIQDVGVRFYTYISSLQEFIETSLQFHKPLIILDRPNPNGFYVDGPVLDTAFSSFVGMQPVPVVYGMTIGEYANFLVGQGLLDRDVLASWMVHLVNDTSAAAGAMNITVIKCRNYTHKTRYILPVAPSPNLPDAGSIYWYPSICFFEGTVLSEGRGTQKPFQIFGHPQLPDSLFAFTPVANSGASNPKFKNQLCYGWNVSGTTEQILKQTDGRIQLKYLLTAYNLFKDKNHFFIAPSKTNAQPSDYFFNKLAGNGQLMEQIIAGKSEQEIRNSWEPKLSAFKKIRKKYLLYPDFDTP